MPKPSTMPGDHQRDHQLEEVEAGLPGGGCSWCMPSRCPGSGRRSRRDASRRGWVIRWRGRSRLRAGLGGARFAEGEFTGHVVGAVAHDPAVGPVAEGVLELGGAQLQPGERRHLVETGSLRVAILVGIRVEEGDPALFPGRARRSCSPSLLAQTVTRALRVTASLRARCMVETSWFTDTACWLRAVRASRPGPASDRPMPTTARARQGLAQRESALVVDRLRAHSASGLWSARGAE